MNQLTIYYNPTINKHKKTVAHAKGIGKVLAIPFEEMPTANNVWTSIYNALDGEIMQIFNLDFLEENKVKPAVFEDWRKLVIHNLEQIHSPIAVNGEEVIICDRQTEIYKLIQPMM